MTTLPTKDGLAALTEREKQTLRLIVRGHDAKSVARSLNLSVHTINERLRDARRKLSVSSSREAARMLLAAEADGPRGADGAGAPGPQSIGDSIIGADAGTAAADGTGMPDRGTGTAGRRVPIILGACVMTFALALLAFVAVPHGTPAPVPAVVVATPDAAVVGAAERWLALLDAARWDESYRLTGAAFRKLNTLAAWTAASEQVRTPLGPMVSRRFMSQQDLPAPPAGYVVTQFRTRFANRADAVETVTFEREAGDWRVVGVTIG